MRTGMEIAFFGSSLVSAYWNGAATYYRGIIRQLHRRGHRVAFYEPDAFGRQAHRDLEFPPWCEVVIYSAEGEAGMRKCLERAARADLVVKASGVGVFDRLLEDAVPALRGPGRAAVFWDVDAPATLERVRADPGDPFRARIPDYDLILTYGGGDPVAEAYRELGARRCVPIYNALDPETHHPAPRDPYFEADAAFLGNRLPDREARVEEFFLKAAALSPQSRYMLGGSGWEGKPMSPSVRNIGHVYTREHNAFNSTPKAILNINRDSMARFGHSPATRVFEAAGAGACIITDPWDGIGEFLEPGREILIARDGNEVAETVAGLDRAEAARIGAAARRRVLDSHTYAHRARQLEAVLAAREVCAQEAA